VRYINSERSDKKSNSGTS